MRVGMGYDIHKMSPGRPCILGGVTIPSPLGPEGHSDADVVIHALMDAMLGALGQGDIGQHFPNTDPKYKDANSMELLSHIMKIVVQRGYRVVNCDIMVIAEEPRMGPHIPEMRTVIAKALAVGTTSVSVKATTNEGLGAIGRKEGIAAQAVCLLETL
ncbi:MAG: 2-C-methyl-D-erythritol 2,4-cyclodiphosphate synthase [Deltaproteobacteria bacterium CG11_big_fil_rev_8_21_14_0_20_47_16]|nr:MAG: 2-C-methyl-D-erythritol 2,4-cyclodiphosphate synthase [Deltaproteobacteria bacterium CG11_big_fil_rev_8_21_14_0_20_47_16]